MDKHQFHTVITSKGTTTIPSRVRRALGLMPGSVVEFSEDIKTGKYVISRVPSLDEIHKKNKKYIVNKKPLSSEQVDKIVAKSIVDRYKKQS